MKQSLLVFTMALAGIFHAFGQLEPCGFFEVDGDPGFDAGDRLAVVADWRTADPVTDFNSDGIVDILDLIRQANCLGGLVHGLSGQYYGFEDGTPGQQISFPDFENLGPEYQPVVVRATEYFSVLEGYRGFMDSDMRRQFGAVYEGYLMVPESANYTLHIWGVRGMRVDLDGSQILEFDQYPSEDAAVVFLEYGLHPIRIEFYNAGSSARILFDWSSDGSVIGPSAEVISPVFLYQEDTPVPLHAITDLELFVFPPSGTRVDQSSVDIDVFAMGPDTDIDLFLNGQEQVTRDGWLEAQLDLDPGLNSFTLRATDGSGRVQTHTYNIYSDTESLPYSGLSAAAYATEVYETLPDTNSIQPFAVLQATGTQMVEVQPFNVVEIDGRKLGRANLLHLQGTIDIAQTGTYTFVVDEQSALAINGEFVCGIWALYPGQWEAYGSLYLEAGRHHYQLRVYDAWSGPNIRVQWAFDSGPLADIPDAVFAHGPAHIQAMPQFSPTASGNRVADGLLTEFMFQPGAIFDDTSGNGFHLNPDPRAIPRQPSGITYQTGGTLFNEQAGVHLASSIVTGDAFSLEVDFISDRDSPQDYRYRPLIALKQANWGHLAGLELVNDDISFYIFDQDGNAEEILAQDVMTAGTRLHVVGTYDGTTMRLFINGAQADSAPFQGLLDAWPNLAHLSVGQRFNRWTGSSTSDDQMFGTFLVAACYSQDLNQAEVQTNQQENLILAPDPSPLPPIPVTPFPPPGTTQAALDEAFHILNRLSFGPSPQTLEELLDVGVSAWIDAQLAPQNIDDAELDAFLQADFFRPTDFHPDFQAYGLMRMVHSNRQLLEVVTQFWENHFNTQKDKVNNLQQELAENEAFRALALTDFEQLLVASATGYPMTVYLDNDANVVGAPNENYAREILELFALGVNNGYTQDDIVQAARCFTGWTVSRGAFVFNPGLHDYGEKQLLGTTIPAGGGLEDGMALIEHLVQMPECADFITWKLCQLFVDDDPPAAVSSAASSTFQNTSGDITAVLQTIFSHPQFRTDLSFRANKVKTPLEFMTSLVRITSSFPMTQSMTDALEPMGMDLFNCPEPTGYAEEGFIWIDTNALLNRWNAVNAVTSNRGYGMSSGPNFVEFIEKRGVTTSAEILDLFEDLTTHSLEAAGARALAEGWLTDGDPGSFLLTPEVLDRQVRQTFGLFLRLPEFQKQ